MHVTRNPRQLAAFTLIELLTVIAIIGILSAITFGVVRSVSERSSISRARGELAMLQLALDAYKAQFGDYPQTDQSDEFLQAMVGKRGPTGAAISRKPFIELSKFTLSNPAQDPLTVATLTLNDPWGMPYRYVYKDGVATAWRQTAFVLYSAGPDQNDTLPEVASGNYNAQADNNPDNIFVD
jgi:prepilin-type N-terminal cleavage/methylation domain-containing protein